MARPVIFVGNRGYFSPFLDVCEIEGREVLGILDHLYYGNTECNGEGTPFIGDERWLLDPANTQAQQWLKTCDFFSASWFNGVPNLENPELSGNYRKLQHMQILADSGANIINLIHPGADVHRTVKLGRGIFVHNQANVQAHVELGDYAWVGPFSVLGTRAKFGTNCTIMGPNTINSEAIVGNNVLFNPHCGAYHRPKEGHPPVIGNNCILQPHAVLYGSLPDNSTWTIHNRRVRNTHYDLLNKSLTH
jgi:acetyltransferase-like isoleucine patch superfamily enzyme